MPEKPGNADTAKPAEEITKEIFKHLVNLAELELSEEEARYLRRELNTQLGAIHELERIQVGEEVQATSHGVPYSHGSRPPLRGDVIDPCEEADKILDQAPEVFERYIVVPEIPTEDLE